MNALYYLPPEHFVTGLHVGNFQVCEHVREQRQEFIPRVVPEVVHPLRPSEKARAVHNVRPPVKNGLQQLLIVARVVLQIGILNEQDVAARSFEAPAQRGPFALVSILKEKPYVL